MLTVPGKRIAMPRRARCADGATHAPTLDSRRAFGTGHGIRRNARPRAAIGRKTRGMARQSGQARCARRILPHRKASLAFGRNEDCGLRCLYHGWKFDTEGNVIDMPSEPKQNQLSERAKHLAYPAREAGGLVWTYMGPKEEMPEFEAPPWAPTADTKVSVAKVELPCNWAQIMEGQIDLRTRRASTRRT